MQHGSFHRRPIGDLLAAFAEVERLDAELAERLIEIVGDSMSASYARGVRDAAQNAHGDSLGSRRASHQREDQR
jgi:hypothetical protein